MVRDDLPDVPEPELVDLRNPDVSRPALEELDWLYGLAMARPIHPEPYPESRRRSFGPSGEPAAAPDTGEPAAEVLREFRERIAPMTYGPHNPGSFGYFTPP